MRRLLGFTDCDPTFDDFVVFLLSDFSGSFLNLSAIRKNMNILWPESG